MNIFFMAVMLCCFAFSGSAQVAVVAASDLNVCAQTAVTGSAPACTTLGTLVIAETSVGAFAVGNDVISLEPPAGWQFCTGSTPTVVESGPDFNRAITPAASFTAGLSITFTVASASALDSISISGIQIQPLTTTALPGYIWALSDVGVSGITFGPTGTDFGDLAIGGAVTAFTVSGGGTICAGSAGMPVSLSGSSLGTVYQLVLNGTTVVSTVSGTGGGINFGPAGHGRHLHGICKLWHPMRYGHDRQCHSDGKPAA